ncbi:uncharacterized protein DUF4249 [Aquimarina sp. MAR_2010_214]|uniref:DUF4249 family protein n=1 Tax=Aquimarina sp. MAR_2010_214 TaxID=1250026 RepID=UPI000C70F559|nr:DUF4249 family protein [Aquimarina sp. MAR_2010_214]PKV50268.1 uncharacterized protein DUF4249 [Aquimarina sp. MAR_2010_214]
MRTHLLIPITIFLFLMNSCKEESIELPVFEKENKIALIGELNQTDPTQIVLAEAGNLTTGSPIKVIKEGKVVILDTEDKIVDELYYDKETKKWKSIGLNQIKAGLRYKISAQLDKQVITSSTLVPKPIDVTITKVTKEVSEVFIEINIENPNEISVSCTIAILSKIKSINDPFPTDGYSRTPIYTNDEETDNYRFNEFTPPFNKVFLQVKEKAKKRIRISVKKNDLDTEFDDYFLWVKSMEKNYYKYLYDYEIQKQVLTYANLPQLNSNITEGVGFWGGCFKSSQKITF